MKRILNLTNVRLNKTGLFLLAAIFFFSPSLAGAGVDTWTSIGPEGGMVNVIAVSPNYETDGTVFAGADRGGGVYKSIDGGATWSQINKGLTYTWVISMAISPDYGNDGTLFVGTHYYDGGLYKSTDGGMTWTQITDEFTHTAVQSVAISPEYKTDRTVFASINGSQYAPSDGAICKSTDGGTTWSRMNNLSGVTSIAISPNYGTDGTLFAGTSSGDLYKSTDEGTTWSQVNIALTNAAVQSIAFSPDYTISDGTIYLSAVSIQSGPSDAGIHKSMDGGMSWTQMCSFDVYSIAVSPNFRNDSTLFIGSSGGVYRVSDYGTYWGIDTYNYCLGTYPVVISPNYVSDNTYFAGSERGVYKSTDGGMSCAQMNSGISVLNVLNIAFSPEYRSDETLFVSSDFYGDGIYKSINGGATWNKTNNGLESFWVDSIAVSPDYVTDSTVFAGAAGVYKSIDGGPSWTHVQSSPYYATSVVLSPYYGSDRNVFSATPDGIYKSTDGGTTWTQIFAESIGKMAISPDYRGDGTIFVTSLDGIYISTDRGTTWSQINDGLTNLHVASIVLSPNYGSDRTIFVGTWSGVYKSTNSGTNWSPVNNGPANIYAIAVSPNYESDATVLTSVWGDGIYISTDAGTTWTQMNSGLANMHINSIALSPNYCRDGTVIAGSSGGGVFSYTFSTHQCDTTPPSTPSILSWTDISISSVTLSWNASSDDVGVAGYTVYDSLTNTVIGSTASTSYELTSLTAGATYFFYVKAYDAAGNYSSPSNTCEVTLPSGESDHEFIPEESNMPIPLSVPLPSGGTTTVTVQFAEITSAGNLEIVTTDTPPAPAPPGYTFLGSQFDFTSDVEYQGTIRLTVPYDPSIPDSTAVNLRLLHWTGTAWVDCTRGVDTLSHTITGEVSSLSPFGIGYPLGSGGYSTGANTNMIALLAIIAISIGVFIIRKSIPLKIM